MIQKELLIFYSKLRQTSQEINFPFILKSSYFLILQKNAHKFHETCTS